MVCIFLADGFEMIEALTPCDILRRAGLDVRLVSVSGAPSVMSTHRVAVRADMPLSEVALNEIDMMILPGGMPGAENLSRSESLAKLLATHAEKKKPIGAICAAPLVLGRLGLLKGKQATCYPGFENELVGASLSQDSVKRDGNILTAKGMGVSLAFSLAAATMLCGKEKADAIAASIMMER